MILGMDLLSKHNARIDCFSKTATSKNLGDLEFTFQRERKVLSFCLISMMATNRCLQKGYFAYLAYVINKDIQEAKLENIHVVKEFPNIFPEELTDLPLDRELKFTIDQTPSSALITQVPYRMAPSKLKELKVQLQDLVDKGFIQPSASP